VRCLQWHFLLAGLSVRVPLRAQLFAFIMGEAMKSMPIGHYVRSYLLARSRDQNLGRLSAAASFVIWIEATVALLGVVVLGLGGWTDWLRPLIVAGLCAAALVLWLLSHVRGTLPVPAWLRTWPLWRRFVAELRQFLAGTKDLLRPRVLAVVVPLGALYLVLGGAGLHVIVLGLSQSQPHTGLGDLSFFNTLAVYFFSLAIGLLFPVPVDFGVTETSGTGGFLAYGAQEYAAVSAMLLNRVLSLASSLVIALIGVIFLHDELRRALQERPGQRPPQTPKALPRRSSLVAYSGRSPQWQGRRGARGKASGPRQQLTCVLHRAASSGEREKAMAGRRSARATASSAVPGCRLVHRICQPRESVVELLISLRVTVR
jgi:uncharacterized membrane protein YbhN (UPF0104 family)